MIDKTYVYDERPGFESYSSVNFPYPSAMMPMPMMNVNGNTNCSQTNQRVSNLENKVNSLEDRIQRLESSMYPTAIDYSQTPNYITSTYQNSMNIM